MPIHWNSDAFHELANFEVHPPTVQMLPKALCRRHHIVLLNRATPGGTEHLKLAMLEPRQQVVVEEVVRLLARRVEVVRLNRFEIERAIQIGFEGALEASVGGSVSLSLDARSPDARALSPDAPVVQVVDALLCQAVREKASDIHLEVYAHDVDVRLRIDGILQQRFTALSPLNVAEAVSRIKILAGLDIAERRRPQDGRFRQVFRDGQRAIPVDFRVSVVPGPAGEDVVMRVLDASHGLLGLEQLGILPDTLQTLQRLLANPEGLLLVTGPTGSGKTTTLYAGLGTISGQARKVFTVEDPIEYTLDHISQKQVTEAMSFHALLRASLRQNPDVIFVGELRDLESASTAMSAASTGHLVLSTLHTGDALGAITRLRGLGIDSSDIAASLLAVLGQRLVRRLCTGCSVPQTVPEEYQTLFGPLLGDRSFWIGQGCARCQGTGYKGRLGLYELLVVDADLQDRIGEQLQAHDLRVHARAAGFRTLTEDALIKATNGFTSLEEIARVIPYRQLALSRADLEGQTPFAPGQ